MLRSMMQFAGSLLSDDQYIVASWDLEQGKTFSALRPLQDDAVLNMHFALQEVAFRDGMRVNFINAMGVTLGDSIVGLNVCHYLRQRYPALHINIVRPATAQPAVEAIYQRAQRAGIIDTLEAMPWRLSTCSEYSVNIDMGNQLFRDSFQRLEMHDYFFLNAGLAPHTITREYKQNHWLALEQHEPDTRPPFVLFCPGASTPLRAIPQAWHKQIIEALQRRFDLPVLGFSDITLPGYQDIREQTTTTQAWIDIIRQAQFVYTADSSALHIAAGFDVPTHAIFTSIAPDLRIRYYPHVTCSVPDNAVADGLHVSNDATRLAQLYQQFEAFYQRGIM
jgi:ADP-heptose:LPS heptosyltransferase